MSEGPRITVVEEALPKRNYNRKTLADKYCIVLEPLKEKPASWFRILEGKTVTINRTRTQLAKDYPSFEFATRKLAEKESAMYARFVPTSTEEAKASPDPFV